MSDLLLIGADVVKMNTVCADTSPLLQIIGWVLTVFKIFIPLIIIIWGIIGLGKAAVSAKPEEIKKSVGSLAWRFVGGIGIYFLPAIILMIFGFFSGFNNAKAQVDFNICKQCLLRPYGGECDNAVTGNTKFDDAQG